MQKRDRGNDILPGGEKSVNADTLHACKAGKFSESSISDWSQHESQRLHSMSNSEAELGGLGKRCLISQSGNEQMTAYDGVIRAVTVHQVPYESEALYMFNIHIGGAVVWEPASHVSTP